MTTEQTIHERLAAPFPVGELKFFPVALTRDKKKARVGSYIDARAVMDRLDEVLGMGNWQTAVEVVDTSAKAVACTLSLRLDGQWVSQSDIGYPNEGKDADNNDKEPLKAAASDALKRAAVHFGIGRYIYSLELVQEWLPVDEYGKFTEQPRLKGAATPRPQQSTGQREMTTANAPKPTFWDVTGQMGYSRERVTAFSQAQFGNREPGQLTTDERKRLVLMLENEAKKEAVSA